MLAQGSLFGFGYMKQKKNPPSSNSSNIIAGTPTVASSTNTDVASTSPVDASTDTNADSTPAVATMNPTNSNVSTTTTTPTNSSTAATAPTPRASRSCEGVIRYSTQRKRGCDGVGIVRGLQGSAGVRCDSCDQLWSKDGSRIKSKVVKKKGRKLNEVITVLQATMMTEDHYTILDKFSRNKDEDLSTQGIELKEKAKAYKEFYKQSPVIQSLNEICI
eukprot:scaffold18588_cov79-Cyclotella_meneghiniana.AAC.7